MAYKQEYMELAIELAKKGTGAVNPNPLVGAVIVKDDRIIGQGYHARYGDLHAERAAFASLTEDAEGAEMYVTLEPCPMCAGATVNARVDRIVFGTEDEAMGACGTAVSVTSLKNAFKPELYRGLLCKECTAILRRFFKARRAERTEK